MDFDFFVMCYTARASRLFHRKWNPKRNTCLAMYVRNWVRWGDVCFGENDRVVGFCVGGGLGAGVDFVAEPKSRLPSVPAPESFTRPILCPLWPTVESCLTI